VSRGSAAERWERARTRPPSAAKATRREEVVVRSDTAARLSEVTLGWLELALEGRAERVTKEQRTYHARDGQLHSSAQCPGWSPFGGGFRVAWSIPEVSVATSIEAMAASGQSVCSACCPLEVSALALWPSKNPRWALSGRQLEIREEERRVTLEAHPELSALVLESRHADLVAWVRGRAWLEAADLDLVASAASFPGAYEALGYGVPMELPRALDAAGLVQGEDRGAGSGLDVTAFLRHHGERVRSSGRSLVLDRSRADGTLVSAALLEMPSREAARTVRLVPTDVLGVLEMTTSPWYWLGSRVMVTTSVALTSVAVEDTDSDEVLETAMTLAAEGTRLEEALEAARALA
jgi:hypothetical protein